MDQGKKIKTLLCPVPPIPRVHIVLFCFLSANQDSIRKQSMFIFSVTVVSTDE